jgi:hypothetical protein
MRGDHVGSNWGVGIENPAFDYSGNNDQYRSESMPTIVAFRRLERTWGYVRLAGLFKQLRSKEEDTYVGGVHLSGQWNTNFIKEKDNLKFGAQYGDGFVHYYSSFVGGLDGFIADNGDIEATGILALHLDYQHWWTDRLRSTIMYSFFDLDSPDLADGLSYSDGERYTVNLFWDPIKSVSFGWELNYQTIETANGADGSGLRFEMVGRFFF